jgi:hypothetical protein
MASGITRNTNFSQGDVCLTSSEFQVETGFSSLPVEMIQIIAGYLPKTDLIAMAKVNSLCRAVALRELVGRVLQAFPGELRQLANEYSLQIPGGIRLSIDAFATQMIASECLGLRKDLIQSVNRNEVGLRDIDQSTQPLKEARVARMLILSIKDSPDSVLKRDFAVRYAATRGHLKIVQLLLNGAIISERFRGLTVENAACNGHLEIVRLLLANGATISEHFRGLAVGNAAYNGHLEIVEFLLANGAMISEQHRGSAVENAARNGHLEIVEFLLANGVTISAENRGLAVRYAATRGHLEIVEFLLANGVTISEQHRGSALENAARNGHLEIVRFLFILEYDRATNGLNLRTHLTRK